MLVTQSERPRELKWYHAGPMLYGDWGTSRFYVLGLALFFSLHASFYYVFAVGVLVAAVGWAYTIICRCYPDGGGVYSAAKHTSKQLAVIGALLLFADYIVTAAMSAYDGIRYMGAPKDMVPYLAMLAILAIGFINYIGPKKAGSVALIITIATLILTFILAGFSVPHISAGIAAIHRPTEPISIQWSSFVGVVLALSGVEAIANMTGIMVPPVTKTAGKAIWPVLVEVVLFNILFALAMNALPASNYDLGPAPAARYEEVERIQKEFPDWATNANAQSQINEQAKLASVTPDVLTSRSAELKERQDHYTDVILRVMAEQYVDPYLTFNIAGHEIKLFSLLCGIVFGLLLLSAVNTAVADMISIQYVMSRDTELPHILTRLNIFGVPWYALVAAAGLPIIVLTIFHDLNTLASLYAVGVVGAIAINLGSCSINRQMPVKKGERIGLAILAVIMLAIETTLVVQKPDARYFALFVVGSGLIARFFTKTYPKLSARGRGISLTTWALFLVVAAGIILHFEQDISLGLHVSVDLLSYGTAATSAVYIVSGLLFMACGTAASYGIRYLLAKAPITLPPRAAASAGPAPAPGMFGTPSAELDMSRLPVLVATRGGERLVEFAASYCKKTNANMFVLFVRQVNVTLTGTVSSPNVEEDPEAIRAFEFAYRTCHNSGVQMMPIYAVSQDVPYTILDFAATYNVEALLMGVSRKGMLLRALQGDVLTAVADQLPAEIPLLIHA